ncbi:hydrolase TatD [Alkalimonas sp.]|uniref:hydrolase TatD n=1 Tax=Alkalimonas sp. TaxID=1872453 RepID=UPI00263BAA55|nr:hydrolase TatD [Alkalimonas sp.]MCC5825712.1 hydrolase TatD [Alkalimonas sp.]
MLVTGLSYLQQGRLTLQTGTALPAARSLLELAEQQNLAEQLLAEPSTAQLLDAIEFAYQHQYEHAAGTEFELKGIAFAGQGDPLLAMELLAEVLPVLKARRHGVPITLVTYGLVPPASAAALCEQLNQLGVEQLEVYLPVANPPAYQQLVQPKAGSFSDVCQFIHSAAEAGLQVSCFAYQPVKHTAELRQLARELGARAFIPVPVEQHRLL